MVIQKMYLRTCALSEYSDQLAQSNQNLSLRIFRIAKDAKFLHANNKDSGQNVCIRRLIYVFVGRTCQKVRFLKLWSILLCLCSCGISKWQHISARALSMYNLDLLEAMLHNYVSHFCVIFVFLYSRLSVSRLRVSRITAYFKVKIGFLF